MQIKKAKAVAVYLHGLSLKLRFGRWRCRASFETWCRIMQMDKCPQISSVFWKQLGKTQNWEW